jgi:hypothetical protein
VEVRGELEDERGARGREGRKRLAMVELKEDEGARGGVTRYGGPS